jgi:hypothetical protein
MNKSSGTDASSRKEPEYTSPGTGAWVHKRSPNTQVQEREPGYAVKEQEPGYTGPGPEPGYTSQRTGAWM